MRAKFIAENTETILQFIAADKRNGIMWLLIKLKVLLAAMACFTSVAYGEPLSNDQESVVEKSIIEETRSPSAVDSQSQTSVRVDSRVSTDLVLRIENESGRQFEIDGAQKLKFAEVCKQIGNFFIKNQGLYGTGPFMKFICASRKSSEQIKYQWILRISEKDGFSSFKLYFLDPTAGKMSLQSSYRIKAAIGPLKILSNERYRHLIAAYLILKLHFNAAIPAKELKDGGIVSLQGARQSDMNFLKSDIKLFKLNHENKIWKRINIGYGKQLSGEGNETKWAIKLKPKIPQVGGLEVSQDFILIGYTAGKKEILKQIDETLQQEVSRDVNELLAPIRSAYIGMRYGVPMGGGEGVLAVTPMIGVLGEFRGGALNGLRLYFDSRPKKEIQLNSYSEEFSLSRVQAGYGFGKILNSPIVNWIDMMPKIGVTSINLAVAVNGDVDAQKYEFQLDNAPVIGLELGVERRSETATARLWLYGNFSLGAREIEKESKSTSYRLGLDLYKDIFSFSLYKASILFFGALESTSFKNKSSATKMLLSSSIQELNYNSLFLGGGLALSW